jgi:hypothetical protein
VFTVFLPALAELSWFADGRFPVGSEELGPLNAGYEVASFDSAYSS